MLRRERHAVLKEPNAQIHEPGGAHRHSGQQQVSPEPRLVDRPGRPSVPPRQTGGTGLEAPRRHGGHRCAPAGSGGGSGGIGRLGSRTPGVMFQFAPGVMFYI